MKKTTSLSVNEDAADFLMDRYEAIKSFEDAVNQSDCGYTPGTIAYAWSHPKERYDPTRGFPKLREECAKLVELIGSDDPYWTNGWEFHDEA